MKNLLESKKGHLIINEMDGEGEIGYNFNVFYQSSFRYDTVAHFITKWSYKGGSFVANKRCSTS